MDEAIKEILNFFQKNGIDTSDGKVMGVDVVELLSRDVSPEEEKLDQAQALIYEAWDAETAEQQIALAKKALEISKYCVDAHNILADHAKTWGEALAIYQHAAELGKEFFGEEFKRWEGNFWGILETRPYMRARSGIVRCLRAMGDTKNLIKHYKELLKLCQNDNLGMRYFLLPLLIATGKDSQAETLYKRYKEDYSAAWFYARALLDFRKHGAGPIADASLHKAFAINKFAPLYLLKLKKLPRRPPDYYGHGDNNEAVILIEESMPAWQASNGALQWLDAAWKQYTPPKAAKTAGTRKRAGIAKKAAE